MHVIKKHGVLLCKVQKKTEHLNSKIFKSENGRLIMQWKYPDCGVKRSRFEKEQEAKLLRSDVGIKTPVKFCC